jgi:N-acetylmuramic acid 6-phosphate etherase
MPVDGNKAICGDYGKAMDKRYLNGISCGRGEIRMAAPVTEQRHPTAPGLDALPGDVVLQHILDQQQAALVAVTAAIPAIDRAARIVADALRAGGQLHYAGAGSSALMACADGLELHGTYGLDPARIHLLMAGGLPVDARMPGDTEDDAGAGAQAAAGIARGDVVIAVTASGSTPYAVAIAQAAQARGAQVVAIANNQGATIFAHADVAIALTTPPEVIAGSTRMGAGTAQKAALNMISTLAGIRLGQVHDGMMVGVVADNAKLRTRAAGMVAAIADVSEDAAQRALVQAKGAVKVAVLLARGLDMDRATAMLNDTDHNLRAALAQMTKSGG